MGLHTVDLNQNDVDIFLTCIRQGRVSLAAKSLNMDVGAVLKALRRLEVEFNIAILEPSVRGGRLTEGAELFADTVRELSAEYARAAQVISDIKDKRSGLFRIGFPDPGIASAMVRPLSEVARRHTELRFKIRMGQPDRLMAQAVVDGDLDLAVMPVYEAVPEGCVALGIRSDPNLPVVRAGHPLASLDPIELKDLVPYKWALAGQHTPITQGLNQVFENAGLARPQIVVENEFASLFSLSLVGCNDLITIVPLSVLTLAPASDFHVLPLSELRRERRLVFLVGAKISDSPLLNKFVQEMTEALKMDNFFE